MSALSSVSVRQSLNAFRFLERLYYYRSGLQVHRRSSDIGSQYKHRTIDLSESRVANSKSSCPGSSAYILAYSLAAILV